MVRPYTENNIVAKDIVYNLLGNKCKYCGVKESLDLHHVTPRLAGGKNILSNIELVCRTCHLDLHKQLRKIFIPNSTGRVESRNIMRKLGYLEDS